MIEFNNKKILVLGLKKSGKAAIRLLKTLNVDIFISDKNGVCEENDPLYKDTIIIRYEELNDHVTDIDIIVKSPGIPYDIPFLNEARNRNVSIISEIELAYHFLEKTKVIVAITGTNGKTTTTSLITEILKNSNIDAISVGNIGYCLSDAVMDHLKADVFVVELSSFQLLDLVEFKPHIAILLNLNKAHLDYHHTFEHYVNAKMNLLKQLSEDCFLVYNADDKLIRKKTKKIKCNKYSFSIESIKNDTYIENGDIKYNGYTILKQSDVKLPGTHNLYNVLAAITTAKIFYIENANIKKTVQQFESLPHRLEFVRKVNGVSYFNDSKSTNSLSTICAINSFEQPIILILGGLDRNQDFTNIVNHKNVKEIIAYGATRDRILAKAIEYHKKCHVAYDLFDVVKITQTIKEEEEIVLFSPASASWDEFKDYVERGNRFISYVQNIKEE